MSAELLHNLIAWSAQVCVLTAAAAVAAITLKQPRARLWFWQAALALALLLPALQPWITVSGPPGEVAIRTGPVTVAHSQSHSAFTFRREYVFFVIVAGIALRLAWIAIGFWRLRRHRLASVLADPPFLAPAVRWYTCDGVSGPVTYGWLRPVILLPSCVNDLDDNLRDAIACHELIHVERRDWLFVVTEELIRAALWFHPAIWFVLSRIQLAREQTVDAEVVRRTRDRESYLNALVAVAEQKFSPAPLFLRKRQLALRVSAVVNETFKEMKMPKIRVAAVFSAALVAARVAMWLFPMQSPAQTADPAVAVAGEDQAISVDAGAPLMHRAPVFRPRGTMETGVVIVEASVNSKGEVTDAHVVSGPDELRKPVLQSVLQWHYSTANQLPSPIRIAVRFDPAPSPATTSPAPEPIAQGPSATLKSIEFMGVSPEVQQRVRATLPVHEGDEISGSSRAEILAAVRQVDEHFNARLNFGPNHQAALTLMLGAPLASVPAPPPQVPSRIRVGGNVQAANLVQKVTPAYPADAKAARVQGQVKLTAIIGKDGAIQSLQLTSGDALLAQAAMDAVKQWVYRPTLLNGNPVEVITEIDVNFTLAQ